MQREAESISPTVPERGCLELVLKLMQGDHYMGRGSRERNLKSSVFGNPFKVAVHEESIPPTVQVRGCLELIRKLMQGNRYVGRGSRQRIMESSVFRNPFKVAGHGRAEAIRRYEKQLRMPPQLSGTRLVCHCDQACHVDSIIAVYKDMFPEAR